MVNKISVCFPIHQVCVYAAASVPKIQSGAGGPEKNKMKCIHGSIPLLASPVMWDFHALVIALK